MSTRAVRSRGPAVAPRRSIRLRVRVRDTRQNSETVESRSGVVAPRRAATPAPGALAGESVYGRRRPTTRLRLRTNAPLASFGQRVRSLEPCRDFGVQIARRFE